MRRWCQEHLESRRHARVTSKAINLEFGRKSEVSLAPSSNLQRYRSEILSTHTSRINIGITPIRSFCSIVCTVILILRVGIAERHQLAAGTPRHERADRKLCVFGHFSVTPVPRERFVFSGRGTFDDNVATLFPFRAQQLDDTQRYRLGFVANSAGNESPHKQSRSCKHRTGQEKRV